MISERTIHGDNILDQIVGEDAYGRTGALNIHDIAGIVDAMHTNYCFTEDGEDRPNRDEKIEAMLARWIDEALQAGGDLN